MIILLNIALLVGVGLGTWWLTGMDNTWGGESKRSHYFTRTLRCIAMLFLSLAFGWMVESPGGGGIFGTSLMVLIPLCMGLVLRSSISELLAHRFLWLLDPAMYDKREFDPKKAQRYQDAIAHLIKTGKQDEAIKLCEELKQSGEVDIVTVENTLEFLGVKQERTSKNPVFEAGHLRTQGKFAEAEQLLKSLLLKNPGDDGAAIMLMRLYAQDLRQPDRAREVLRVLEKQPHVHKDHLEFARRSIDEWSRPQPTAAAEPASPAGPQSLDDLLAQGGFGAAIELLEQQIKAQPGDFEVQLKLAEVFAIHCKNLIRAEKIIRRIEFTPNFSQQQIAEALAKFKEWQIIEKSPRLG